MFTMSLARRLRRTAIAFSTYETSTRAIASLRELVRETGKHPAMLHAVVDAHDQDDVRVTISLSRRSPHGEMIVTMIDDGKTVTAPLSRFEGAFSFMLRREIQEKQDGR